MRKTALLLSLVMLLSACSGGAEESPAAVSDPPAVSGVGQADPTATPASAPAETAAPSEEGPAKSGSAAPSGSPSTEPDVTFVPPASPSPEEPGVSAGTVAGEDYDFSQPVPETAAVGEDYFADAVMIGDSRTEGFKLFSGLTQGTYMAHTGLMIFKIFDTEITLNGEKMTVPEALDEGTYGKVYISLGVNELGMYDDQGYHDNFAKFVDFVREKQPEATIYIQLLIPVNTQKCKDKGQADYVTNEQIGVYNDLLRQVAQEKQVFLVDPAQAIVDETGEPPYDETADGVHFQPTGYQLWYDYLTKHTIDKGDFA